VLQLIQRVRGVSPLLLPVVAALLVIVGIAIILFPPLLVWIVGVAFILAGVAALAGTFMTGEA
jgi:hypothetical protein